MTIKRLAGVAPQVGGSDESMMRYTLSLKLRTILSMSTSAQQGKNSIIVLFREFLLSSLLCCGTFHYFLDLFLFHNFHLHFTVTKNVHFICVTYQ